MGNTPSEWVQWCVNQGVAVAVLAFLLVRLEARLARLETLIQTLIDARLGAAPGDSTRKPA